MKFLRFLLTLLIMGSVTGCQSSAENKKVEQDNSQRASLHYRLGIDALHKGFLPKAFEELMISDQISPNQPETLDAIAYAWRIRGDQKEARKYYELAIDSDASSATRNNYGSLLVEMGEYKKAVEQLNISLEDPRYRNQSLAFTNLGDAFVGLKQYEEAIKAYRKAHLLSPNWSYPQLREAQAYTKFERPHYAQALYETILRKEPTNQTALKELILLLKGKNEDSLLRKYLQTFIDKTPDDLQKAWAKDEIEHLKK